MTAPAYPIAPERTPGLAHAAAATWERRLGAPDAAGSAVTWDDAMRADAGGDLPAACYVRLDALGLPETLVPEAEGGTLTSLSDAMMIWRALFRRDPAMGLGYGITSLIATLPVLCAGTEAQRAEAARVIKAGSPVSVAFNERGAGNDILGMEVSAERMAEGGYRLSGTKWLVNNIDRAGAAVLFARTGDARSPRGFSLFLLNASDLAAARTTERIETKGARACQLRGKDFTGVKIPAGALIGREGQGFEIAGRAFQISRAVLPGMSLGLVETALRLVHDFACERRLYGKRMIDLPLVRRDLARAYAEFVVLDALGLYSARLAQSAPRSLGRVGPVAKFAIPLGMSRLMSELSVLLGARHYVRDGSFGLFNKLLRDVDIASLGHASSGICLSLLIPYLRQLGRSHGEPPIGLPEHDPALRLDLALPRLGFDALTLSMRGHDPFLSLLPAVCSQLAPVPGGAAIADALREEARSLETRAASAGDDAEWYALAERYCQFARLLAAAAMWRANAGQAAIFPDTEVPWWLRLAHRPGPARDAYDEPAVSAALADLERRKAQHLGLGVHAIVQP